MIRTNSIFAAGPLLLAIAILMNRFLPEKPVLDFLEGLFIGLSLVLNLKYILQKRKNRIQAQ